MKRKLIQLYLSIIQQIEKMTNLVNSENQKHHYSTLEIKENLNLY